MLQPRSSTRYSRAFNLSAAFRIWLHSRRFSTSCPALIDRPKSVAIVGGGITGLATAFYLTKLSPLLSITLYEASSTCGGWIRTEHFKAEDGVVMFESGPRTIRLQTTESLVTLDLIRQLNLTDKIICISKDAPAATKRYIYYPNRLNELPNSIQAALKSFFSPLMEGLVLGTLKEPFIKTRPPEVQDESIGDFLSRRLGRKPTENITSAIWHGIYAGNLYKLSAKSLLPLIWHGECKYGSIYKFGKALLKGEADEKLEDQILTDQLTLLNRWLIMEMQDVMAITFNMGLKTLTSALIEDLRKSKNVTIKEDTAVTSISLDQSNSERPVKVGLADNRADNFSHGISTLFAPITSALIPGQINPLSAAEAVTVMVVNLYYHIPNLTPVRGFGYLLPISVPETYNPERALGVIFDSEILPQDPTGSHFAKGTKLTVMLGGHYWDGKKYPSEEEGVIMAKNVVGRHLGIWHEPELTMATLQVNCIPQPTVGHHQRIRQAHEELKRKFNGRLSVAGSSYRGVGVNDCVRSARDVAYNIWRGGDEGGWTGLESFVDEKWVPKRKALINK